MNPQFQNTKSDAVHLTTLRKTSCGDKWNFGTDLIAYSCGLANRLVATTGSAHANRNRRYLCRVRRSGWAPQTPSRRKPLRNRLCRIRGFFDPVEPPTSPAGIHCARLMGLATSHSLFRRQDATLVYPILRSLRRFGGYRHVANLDVAMKDARLTGLRFEYFS